MDNVKSYLNNGYHWTNSKIKRLPNSTLSEAAYSYTVVFADIASSTLPLRLLAAMAAALGLYLNQPQPSLWMAVLFSFLYVLYAAYSWLLANYLFSILPVPYALYGAIVVDAAVSVGILTLLSGLSGLLGAVLIFYLAYLYFSSARATVLESLEGADDIEDIIEEDISSLTNRRAETQVVEVQKWKEDRNTKMLLEAARKLTSTLDFGLVVNNVAHLASDVTGLSKCVVMLRDNSGYLVGKAANIGPEVLGIKALEELVEIPSKRSLAHKVWSARSPVDMNNQNGMRVPRDGSPLYAHGSILAIPLLHGDEPLGIIYAFDGVERSFTESEKDAAQKFADLSAQAIKNAKTYEEVQSRMSKLGGDLTAAVRQLEQVRESERRNAISINGLTLDAAAQRVTLMDQIIDLSPTEFRLLYALAERAGTSVGQDTLFEKAWGEAPSGQTNVVDVYIHRLRKKIEEDATSPKRILTVRGEGYKLC